MRRFLACLMLTGCTALSPPEPVRDRPGVTQILQKVLPGAALPAGYDEVWAQEFMGLISVSWHSKDPAHNLNFELQSSGPNPTDDTYYFNYAGKKVSEKSETFVYQGKSQSVPSFVIANGSNTLYYHVSLIGQQRRYVHIMVSGPDKKPDRPALESFLKSVR